MADKSISAYFPEKCTEGRLKAALLLRSDQDRAVLFSQYLLCQTQCTGDHSCRLGTCHVIGGQIGTVLVAVDDPGLIAVIDIGLSPCPSPGPVIIRKFTVRCKATDRRPIIMLIARSSDTARFFISVFSFTNQLLDTPLLYNRSCLRPAVYDLPCVVNCLRLLHRHMVLSFSDILNGAPVLAWISSAVMPSRCSVRRNPSDGET